MDKKEMFIKDAIICVIIAIIMVCFGIFGEANLAFKEGIAFFVFGSIFTTITVFIADLLRIFAAPDIILTGGFSDSLKTKLFWKFGPQGIGWVIGLLITNGFLANTIGLAAFAS
ncbi:MAG: hypothetical protein OCC45_08585 [Desulfotalea sp.]